jgi:O-antigen ligase
MDILLVIFLALAVAYFIFAVRNVNQAVLALPLFFPLYLYKVNFFGIPFTLMECFVYAVFLAFIIKLFSGKKPGKYLKDGWHLLRTQSFFWPVIFILLTAVISTFITSDRIMMIDSVTAFYGRKIALGILKGWIFAPIILFVLLFAVIRKGSDVLKMLNYYTVSALMLALWGLFQVLSVRYITADARASGPFESANYLALYVAPAVLYLLIRLKDVVFPLDQMEKYSFWKLPFKRRKAPLEHPESLFFIFGFLILALVLLFTKSYAAMMAVAGAAVFYFGLEYCEYRKSKGKPLFSLRLAASLLMVLIVAFLAVFFVDPAKLSGVARFDLRNSSSVRVEVYTISTDLIKENWFTGIGLGQFPAYYQLESVRMLGHVPYEWNMLHPHNLYLAFWLNLGLAGFIAFCALIFTFLKSAHKSLNDFAFQKSAESDKLKMIGLSLMMIILLHGIFDTPFFKNDLAMIFWMIAAVIYFPKKEWKK